MIGKRAQSAAVASSVTRVRCPLCHRKDLILTADGKYPPHWNKRDDCRCLNSGNKPAKV